MIALLAIVGFVPCFGQVVVVVSAPPPPPPHKLIHHRIPPRRVVVHQAPPPRPQRPLPPKRYPLYMPPQEIVVKPVHVQKQGRPVRYVYRNGRLVPVRKRWAPRRVPPTPTGRIN